MEPIFYCRLETGYNDLNGQETVAIATTELPEGIHFKVTGYSQVDTYTLVMWQQGNDAEYFTGENLWIGYEPIVTTGGILELYSATPTTEKILPNSSIWDRVDTTIGSYGIPATVAITLRDIGNIVYV